MGSYFSENWLPKCCRWLRVLFLSIAPAVYCFNRCFQRIQCSRDCILVEFCCVSVIIEVRKTKMNQLLSCLYISSATLNSQNRNQTWFYFVFQVQFAMTEKYNCKMLVTGMKYSRYNSWKKNSALLHLWQLIHCCKLFRKVLTVLLYPKKICSWNISLTFIISSSSWNSCAAFDITSLQANAENKEKKQWQAFRQVSTPTNFSTLCYPFQLLR